MNRIMLGNITWIHTLKSEVCAHVDLVYISFFYPQAATVTRLNSLCMHRQQKTQALDIA